MGGLGCVLKASAAGSSEDKLGETLTLTHSEIGGGEGAFKKEKRGEGRGLMRFANSSQLRGAFKAPVPFRRVRRAQPGPQRSGALSERCGRGYLPGCGDPEPQISVRC